MNDKPNPYNLLIDNLLDLDERRRELITKIEKLREYKNKLQKEIDKSYKK